MQAQTYPFFSLCPVPPDVSIIRFAFAVAAAAAAQLTFTFSKSTIETLEQSVKYFQS